MPGQQRQMNAAQNAKAQTIAAQIHAAGIDEATVEEVQRQLPTMAEMIHGEARRWIATSRPN